MTGPYTATATSVPDHRFRDRVLVVTEDPSFIADIRAVAEAERARVIACLGPAASPCFLDTLGRCPLAASCRVVVVESPPSGSFKYRLKDIPAGEYAERLQRVHPNTHVLFIPSSTALSGPTGEVAVVADRSESVRLLPWILRAPTYPGGAHERRKK